MDVDPKFKVSPGEELKANLKGMVLVARSAPLLLFGVIGVTSLQGLMPPVIVGATGVFLNEIPQAITDGIDSAAGATSRNSLVLIAAAILASQLLGPVHEALQFGLQRRFRAYLSLRLMMAVSSLPGMAYFEDPKFRDKLEISEWIGWAPVQTVRLLTQSYQQITTLVGFVIVAASLYEWWVALLVVGAAVPAGFAAIHYESIIGLARWRHSPEMRRSDYFRKLALKLEPAKELRIFRLKDWILGRQEGHYFASMKEAWAKRRRGLTIRLGLQLPAVAALAFAYVALLRDAVAGIIPAGTFGAVSMALVGMASMIVAVFNGFSWVRRSNYYLPVAFQILGLRNDDPRLDVSGTLPARDIEPSGITFEGVSFAYPGTDRKVLDGLDLFIPAGGSLALVGENGAGKTTLIKLLCRLYDPTEGRILLDGIDIRTFDLEELRTRLAVIFQDFVHYQLTARDNVGFGAVSRGNDEELTVEAARRVGVLEKIEGLPKGWETPLAREFDGVDLSGGEWQRVALARAIMAQIGRNADVLILDEPTASLDVRLEHELYEHFAELAGGRTTILVSHRFSTVRMAERIVFIADGRVVEDGTHAELMEHRGRYAELYELQASHYRMTGTLE